MSVRIKIKKKLSKKKLKSQNSFLNEYHTTVILALMIYTYSFVEETSFQ
jgi:hypothetical protein